MTDRRTVAALTLLAGVALAADAQEEGEPVRCIAMGSVQSTRIVDDDNILFYQRGGRVFLNKLDRTCVGLQRYGKFTYQVQSGARYVRLCSTDTITVLETTGRGFSCGLGDFIEVSSDAAAALLDPSRADAQRRAISVEPAQVPEPPPTQAPSDAPAPAGNAPRQSDAPPPPP